MESTQCLNCGSQVRPMADRLCPECRCPIDRVVMRPVGEPPRRESWLRNWSILWAVGPYALLMAVTTVVVVALETWDSVSGPLLALFVALQLSGHGWLLLVQARSGLFAVILCLLPFVWLFFVQSNWDECRWPVALIVIANMTWFVMFLLQWISAGHI